MRRNTDYRGRLECSQHEDFNEYVMETFICIKS